jgi:hypothetical protein
MAALLLWVTLAIGSQSFAVQDRFDIIELNHTHDQMGRPKFVQLIFWDWSPKKKSFVCQGYYMLDGSIVKTEEGKKDWDKKVEKALKRVAPLEKAILLKDLQYKGHYQRHAAHPVRLWAARVYRSKWIDKTGAMRSVVATQFRETRTYHDPEVEDRKRHPVALRKGLSKP